MTEKKLGWIFMTDGFEGIPYIKCPYCGRKVSGKTAMLAPLPLDHCPDCAKQLRFDNMKEEDWLYISEFFGEDQ